MSLNKKSKSEKIDKQFYSSKNIKLTDNYYIKNSQTNTIISKRPLKNTQADFIKFLKASLKLNKIKQNRIKMQSYFYKWRKKCFEPQQKNYPDLNQQQVQFLIRLNVSNQWLISQLSILSSQIKQSYVQKQNCLQYWRNQTLFKQQKSKYLSFTRINQASDKIVKIFYIHYFKLIKYNIKIVKFVSKLKLIFYKVYNLVYTKLNHYSFLKIKQTHYILKSMILVMNKKIFKLISNSFNKLFLKNKSTRFPFFKINQRLLNDSFKQIKKQFELSFIKQQINIFIKIIIILEKNILKQFLHYFKKWKHNKYSFFQFVKLFRKKFYKFALDMLKRNYYTVNINTTGKQAKKFKAINKLVQLKLQHCFLGRKQGFIRLKVRTDPFFALTCINRICLYSKISSYNSLWRFKTLLDSIQKRKGKLLLSLQRLSIFVTQQKLKKVIGKIRQFYFYVSLMKRLYENMNKKIIENIKEFFASARKIPQTKNFSKHYKFQEQLKNIYIKYLKKSFEQLKLQHLIAFLKKFIVLRKMLFRHQQKFRQKYIQWKYISNQIIIKQKSLTCIKFFQNNQLILISNNRFLFMNNNNLTQLVFLRMIQKWIKKKNQAFDKFKQNIIFSKMKDYQKNHGIKDIINLMTIKDQMNLKNILKIFQLNSEKQINKNFLIKKILNSKTGKIYNAFQEWTKIPVNDPAQFIIAFQFQEGIKKIINRKYKQSIKQFLDLNYKGISIKRYAANKMRLLMESQFQKSFKKFAIITKKQNQFKIPNLINTLFDNITNQINKLNYQSIFSLTYCKHRQIMDFITFFIKKQTSIYFYVWQLLKIEKYDQNKIKRLIVVVAKIKYRKLIIMFNKFRQNKSNELNFVRGSILNRLFALIKNKQDQSVYQRFIQWKKIIQYVNPWQQKCIHLLAKHSKLNKQIAFWRGRDAIIVNQLFMSKATVIIRKKLSIQKLFNWLRMRYQTIIGKAFWMVQTFQKELNIRQKFYRMGQNIIEKSIIGTITGQDSSTHKLSYGSIRTPQKSFSVNPFHNKSSILKKQNDYNLLPVTKQFDQIDEVQ